MPSRARKQRETRNEWVRFVSRALWRNLQHDKDRILTTNRLLPLGSLKRESVRDIFKQWIVELLHEGRVLTKKFAKVVCTRLRKKFGLHGEVEKAEWERSHALLKAARKRQLGNPRCPTMSAMDMCDNLPMDDGFGFQDRACANYLNMFFHCQFSGGLFPTPRWIKGRSKLDQVV